MNRLYQRMPCSMPQMRQVQIVFKRLLFPSPVEKVFQLKNHRLNPPPIPVKHSIHLDFGRKNTAKPDGTQILYIEKLPLSSGFRQNSCSFSEETKQPGLSPLPIGIQGKTRLFLCKTLPGQSGVSVSTQQPSSAVLRVWVLPSHTLSSSVNTPSSHR